MSEETKAPLDGERTTREEAEAERAQSDAAAMARGQIATMTIFYHLGTKLAQVQGPSDPILAFGMLEMAKVILSRDMTAPVEGHPAPEKETKRIVTVPSMPGLRAVGGR